jgi:hypothetical protein
MEMVKHPSGGNCGITSPNINVYEEQGITHHVQALLRGI